MSLSNSTCLILDSSCSSRVGGLPKITETYFFFQIDDHRVHEFRLQLAKLIPLITTTAQVLDDRKKLAGNKTGAGEEKKLIRMSGVNIAFTQKGLVKVCLFISPLTFVISGHSNLGLL